MLNKEFDKKIYFNKYIKSVNEAKQYVIDTLPSKFYKFVYLHDLSSPYINIKKCKDSNEKKFYSLENNMLWFSDYKHLNDPFEFSWLDINYDNLPTMNGKTDDEIKKELDYFVEYTKKQFKIVSLSTQMEDSISTWTYYTNDHHGYCCEYEIDKTSDGLKNLFPVFYETEKRISSFNQYQKYIKICNECIKYRKNNEDVPDELLAQFNGIRDYFKVLLSTKDTSWENEHEYRYFHECATTEEMEAPGCNIDISKIGLKLSCITIGKDCAKDDIEKIIKIAHKLGVKVRKSRPSRNKYALEYAEL